MILHEYKEIVHQTLKIEVMRVNQGHLYMMYNYIVSRHLGGEGDWVLATTTFVATQPGATVI
jgi:hypothetical protein